MSHRHITDVPAFAATPCCGHLPLGGRADDRCAADGEVWMVASTGEAVVVYCRHHADEALAEYGRVLATDPHLADILAGWTAVPIRMAVPA